MDDQKPWKFLKDYFGKYRSHAWRIVFSYGAPMAQYCVALYDVIRNESIPGGCRLRYDSKRAYKMDELYRLAAIPDADGRKAWRILEEQGLLAKDKDGTIVVLRQGEMLGSETDSAIRMRRMRGKQGKTQQNPPEPKSNNPVTSPSQCDDDVPASLKNPIVVESERLRAIDGKSNDDKEKDNINPSMLSKSPGDDDGLISDPKKQADAFYGSYPKKTKPDDVARWFAARKMPAQEFGALMIALDRAKTNAQWSKNGNQFVPLPVNWLSRHPWTKQDEETFARHQYEVRLNKPPVQEDLPRKREMPTVEAKQIKEG